VVFLNPQIKVRLVKGEKLLPGAKQIIPDNEKIITEFMEQNIKDGGHLFNFFTSKDGVSKITGAPRSNWDIKVGNKGIFNFNATSIVAGFLEGKKDPNGFLAHGALADPNLPVSIESNEIGSWPRDLPRPQQNIHLNKMPEFYAMLTGWPPPQRK